MSLPSTISRSSTAETDICQPADVRPAQILTVNVEEYFQAGVFHRFIDEKHWYRFDSRLQKNIEDTLEVLEQHSTQATFFVLGWIAERYPELVRRISDAGHEVASRGFLHQPLLKRERGERCEDLRRSRTVLQDVTGQPIYGFRLSDGWMHQVDLPFLEDIGEAGYRYDSSLMPRRRDFRHEPSRRTIHQHALSCGTLFEIPPSTIRLAGSWLPIAGGNYQRQFPDAIMRSAVARWVRTETSPFVMYLQSWELDSDQPELSAPGRLSRLRHYRNLGKYRWLLPEYLKTWRFVSVSDYAGLPDSPLASMIHSETSPPVSRTTVVPSVRLRPSEALSLQRSSNHAADRTAPISGPVALDIRNGRRAPESRTGVTLVIPCFNEEGSLPYLSRTLVHLKHALSVNYDLQIVFVDDCSRDNTRDVLQQLFATEPQVRIIHHEVNRGVSAAILTGMQAATTDIVCSMDCDCSYDPHELQHMLPLMKPGVALVTASPYHRDGRVRNVPAWRLMLSHSLSVMYRLLLQQSLHTWTSCFRVYRRSQILDLPLQENGFLGTAELAAQLCLHGRTIAEHPAVLEVRLFGASKMKTLRTIASHLRLLTRIVLQRVGGERFVPQAKQMSPTRQQPEPEPDHGLGQTELRERLR